MMTFYGEYVFTPEDLLDLSKTRHGALFPPGQPVWEALKRIAPYLEEHLSPEILGDVSPSAHIGDRVRIGKGTVVEPGAVILGPAWIGENCKVRAGCYVRENVIAGDNVTMGNSCEFKNCLLFDNVETPHYNYVGDSILGYKAHLGAGVICSNVKLNRQNISVTTKSGEILETGLRKFGAIVGDHTEVGCNSVLSPGSILGRSCILYPGCHWQGPLAEDHMVKVRQTHELVRKR